MCVLALQPGPAGAHVRGPAVPTGADAPYVAIALGSDWAAVSHEVCVPPNNQPTGWLARTQADVPAPWPSVSEARDAVGRETPHGRLAAARQSVFRFFYLSVLNWAGKSGNISRESTTSWQAVRKRYRR